MRILYTILLLLFSGVISVNSQVVMEGKLSFTHTDDSLRNFYGVSAPDSLDQAVRVTEYAYQKYFENEIVLIGDSLLHISSSFEFPLYETGMNLSLKLPQIIDTINTPRYLKINQHPAVLIRQIDLSIISNSLMKSNQILNLIYNGSSFICFNQPVYKCPGGFKKMTNDYCIQVNRNPQATFWNANSDCIAQGFHLCNFEEWYYACVNNSGLNQLPQNFEWVHTSSNHNIHALKIGSGANCQTVDSETTAVTGLPMYYRCCYHLR